MKPTTKGQISLWIAITMAVGSITAAGVTGWFSAASVVSSRVAAAEARGRWRRPPRHGQQ